MPDTKISALTDGTTANSTDRIPVARSPFASGDNRYITPDYIKTLIIGGPSTQLGAADAASAVAQTLQVQSSTGAGTTGPNFTIKGSAGTTAGGSIIFQTAATAAAGYAAALTLAADKTATFGGDVICASGKSFYDALNNYAVMGAARGDGGINIYSGGQISFCDNSSARSGTVDVVLRRDAGPPVALALRNGTNAQTFNIYGTYTDSSNYETLRLGGSLSSDAFIQAVSAGTGTQRNLQLVTGAQSVIIRNSNLTFFTDNTNDIGASGGSRPRNVYAYTAFELREAGYFGWNGRAAIYSDAANNIRLYGWGASISLLQFGGTTSSFPALKRSSATLQVRLADDSANAALTCGTTTSGGTALNVTGTGDASIMSVTNTSTGTLLQVLNSTSNPLMTVTDTTSGTLFSVQSTTAATLFSVNDTTSGSLLSVVNSSSATGLDVNSNGSVICNSAAVATTATDGFLYVPSCAGTPTGVPTTYTGRIAVVADSTNNKLYIYSGGAWVALN